MDRARDSRRWWLDARLDPAMPAACLSHGVSDILEQGNPAGGSVGSIVEIGRGTGTACPDFLPDVAHLVGWVFATGF